MWEQWKRLTLTFPWQVEVCGHINKTQKGMEYGLYIFLYTSVCLPLQQTELARERWVECMAVFWLVAHCLWGAVWDSTRTGLGSLFVVIGRGKCVLSQEAGRWHSQDRQLNQSIGVWYHADIMPAGWGKQGDLSLWLWLDNSAKGARARQIAVSS